MNRRVTLALCLVALAVSGVAHAATTSRLTVDLFEQKFVGAYLALIGFALITMLVLRFVRIPTPTAAEQSASGRPLMVIAAQPKFFVAVLAGAIGYGVMNFLMTSTPIAMRGCGHPYGDAAFVISSHVVAMFAPSFVTGALIRRFGVLPIMFVGAVLNVGSIAIALSGVSVPQFWGSLVLLGVGWNFLFIGATTLLTDTYRPEERAKAQGANDFAIFFMMTISSLTSGMIVTTSGWEKVNYAAAPMIAVIAIAVAWLGLRQRAARAAA